MPKSFKSDVKILKLAFKFLTSHPCERFLVGQRDGDVIETPVIKLHVPHPQGLWLKEYR